MVLRSSRSDQVGRKEAASAVREAGRVPGEVTGGLTLGIS